MGKKRESRRAPANGQPRGNKAKVRLAACPCGKEPEGLNIEAKGKYGTVMGSCCGEWSVEFLANYSQDKEAMLVKARAAWNAASRG